MTKSNCTTIRREVDELMLGEDCSAAVLQHLKECNECLEFEEKQTRLRQIVGSLGVVSAPTNFDSQLRSRLAENGRANSAVHTFWLLTQRTAAVAAATLLFFGAVLFVRYYATHKSSEVTAEKQNTERVQPAVPSMSPQLKEAKEAESSKNPQVALVPLKSVDDGTKRVLPMKPRLKPVTVAYDMSSNGAPVISSRNATNDSEPIFPVDAAQQSLKVSLLDGRGNPHTISLPSVSFGSQRAVSNQNSFAPKGVW